MPRAVLTAKPRFRVVQLQQYSEPTTGNFSNVGDLIERSFRFQIGTKERFTNTFVEFRICSADDMITQM